jgi:hypothetical protein
MHWSVVSSTSHSLVNNASKDLSQSAGEVACDSAAIPMSGATCAHTPNSHQSDWQECDTIPRCGHQSRRSVSEDRRKMLVPSALIAAASPGKLRLAKYCSYGYSFMDTARRRSCEVDASRRKDHFHRILPGGQNHAWKKPFRFQDRFDR